MATARKITELTRTDIVDALVLDKTPFVGALDIISFLKRIWPLETMPSQDSRFDNAEGDIWQHVVNNYDYTESELLYRRLKICSIPDEQFIRFLEVCMLPVVARDPQRIEELAVMFNKHLAHDGFVAKPVGKVSGRAIYKVVSTTGEDIGETYEIVLSFAGEDRKFVEQVASTLRFNDVSLFYDSYEQVSLWGKNLIEHLHKVYSGSARYCVMFISKHYAEKVWPTHERRSAFEKAIEAKDEYILPARFDDTEIPGLHKAHWVHRSAEGDPRIDGAASPQKAWTQGRRDRPILRYRGQTCPISFLEEAAVAEPIQAEVLASPLSSQAA